MDQLGISFDDLADFLKPMPRVCYLWGGKGDVLERTSALAGDEWLMIFGAKDGDVFVAAFGSPQTAAAWDGTRAVSGLTASRLMRAAALQCDNAEVHPWASFAWHRALRERTK